MWLPGIVLFNILKASLNAGITLLLYKSVVTILRKTHLVEGQGQHSKGSGLIIIGLFITISIICVVLAIQGLI